MVFQEPLKSIADHLACVGGIVVWQREFARATLFSLMLHARPACSLGHLGHQPERHISPP